jgi:hypothetical protein
LSPEVRLLLANAQAAYQQSQTDLHAGNLGAYQGDITTLETDLQQVQQLTGAAPPAPAGTSSTTTTTTPGATTTTTAPA